MFYFLWLMTSNDFIDAMTLEKLVHAYISQSFSQNIRFLIHFQLYSLGNACIVGILKCM